MSEEAGIIATVPGQLHTSAKRRLTRRVKSALRELVHPHSLPDFGNASFSQAGEDRIVRFLLGELSVQRPTYLDVGAYHPFRLSNTALFYVTGSRGINVEADPDSFAAFLRHRPDDINLNVGCSDRSGRLTFYRMSEPTLNTFDADSAARAVEASGGRHSLASTVEVSVVPVADILSEHRVTSLDFLSLDVEGLDLRILSTMTDWPTRPTAICVETITYSEHGVGAKIPAIAALLKQHGYMPFADTYVNTIFVLRDVWVGH